MSGLTSYGCIICKGINGLEVTSGTLESCGKAKRGTGCGWINVDAVLIGVKHISMGSVTTVTTATVKLSTPLGLGYHSPVTI
jgi:hypothetical protein